MKYNYLQQLNQSRTGRKFDLIYLSILNDIDLYPHIKSARSISDNKLNLILELINKPQYVISLSTSRTILLLEAIFMSELLLIMEGVLDKVTLKIKLVIDHIAQGIKKVLDAGSAMIKTFCLKVKLNKLVKAIIAKLKLDLKLNYLKFKQFVKVKSADGKEVGEQSELIKLGTKLSKALQSLTDPELIKAQIQKWEDAISGKKPLKNARTGNPLSKKYCTLKLNLFKKKLAEVGGDNSDSKSQKNSSKQVAGEVQFDVLGISEQVKNVKLLSLNNPLLNKEQPLLKKLSKVDKFGNKLKGLIKKGISKAKDWFSKQNPLVKVLIVCVIAVLAILAIVFLYLLVVLPLLAGCFNGGIIKSAVNIFRVVVSGKTFAATYKQGKKSWLTGELWGKTFKMIGLSILAALNVGDVINKGMGLVNDTTGTGSAAATAASAAGAADTDNDGATDDLIKLVDKGFNHFDIDGNGKLDPKEVVDLMKHNALPGIDLTDPKYRQIPGGWSLLNQDLHANPLYKLLISKKKGINMKMYNTRFWSLIKRLGLMSGSKNGLWSGSGGNDSYLAKFIEENLL